MLNDRERLFSFAAAVVAAGFGIAIYVSETSNKNFRLAKGELTPQTMLLIGLAAAALLVVATLVGRRAPVGFLVSSPGRLLPTNSFVLALPFWALAFWLLYRMSQPEPAAAETQELRAERAGSKHARPRPARSSGRGSGSGQAKSGSGPGPSDPRPTSAIRRRDPRPSRNRLPRPGDPKKHNQERQTALSGPHCPVRIVRSALSGPHCPERLGPYQND